MKSDSGACYIVGGVLPEFDMKLKTVRTSISSMGIKRYYLRDVGWFCLA